MTGEDMKAIRALYGETQAQFARRLGYEGSDATLKRKVIRYEGGETPIVGTLAVLLDLLRSMVQKGDTRRRSKGTSPL